jgi:preprotein translocase subunit SecD
VLGVAFCVVIFIPCACGSSGAWAAASKPSGSSLLVTLEPANSGASARGLAADARIFERRARDLGIANDVSVSISNGTIVLDLRGSRAQADLGELEQMDQLFFRPVLCAANTYIPPVPKKKTTTSSTTTLAKSKTTTSTTVPKSTTTTTVPKSTKKVPAGAYVKPPACGASYRCTTATYSTAQSYNPGSPPDPALDSVPSTPALQDKASRTVLICSSPASPCTGRYELGPTPYDGTVPATGEILASANAEFQTTTGWVVNFTIKSQYSAFFDTIAKKLYHLPLAVDLGGVVESAPTINAQSFGGSGEISGSFTHRRASSLALLLSSGAVPLPLKVAYTQTSG